MDNPHPDADFRTVSLQRLLATALMLAVGFAVASFYPTGLVLPAFSTILQFAAMGAAIAALLLRESTDAPFLTHWDEAAALIGASLFAKLWVDPAAVEQALKALETAAG